MFTSMVFCSRTEPRDHGLNPLGFWTKIVFLPCIAFSGIWSCPHMYIYIHYLPSTLQWQIRHLSFGFRQLSVFAIGEEDVSMPWCECGGQRTIHGSCLSSPTTCIPRDETQVVRLGNKRRCPLSHLAGFSAVFKIKNLDEKIAQSFQSRDTTRF